MSTTAQPPTPPVTTAPATAATHAASKASTTAPTPGIPWYDTVEGDAKKVISFGVSHLILIALLFGAILFGNYEYTVKRAEIAELKANASVEQAARTDASNKSFQALMEEEISELKVQNSALAGQVTTLAHSITQRDTSLATRTTAITKLPPTELAQQWGAAAHETAPAVSPDGSIAASVPLAQKSLTALDQVPVLQQDKADLQQSLGIQEQSANNSAAALGKEEQAHLADNAACTADKTALNTELKAEKVQARKGRIKSFFEGFFIGAAAVGIHFL